MSSAMQTPSVQTARLVKVSAGSAGPSQGRGRSAIAAAPTASKASDLRVVGDQPYRIIRMKKTAYGPTISGLRNPPVNPTMKRTLASVPTADHSLFARDG